MKSVVKAFINFEKEEKWLNDMSAKGFELVDCSFLLYKFKKGRPGEYIYRLELLDEMPSSPKSQDYIKFMKDMGAECVSTYLRWVYFRKKASEGPFDIYSDYDSRINYYKKVVNFSVICWIVNLVAAIDNLMVGLEAGRERGFYFNSYISIISWILVFALGSVIVTYIKRINAMKKAKNIYQ